MNVLFVCRGNVGRSQMAEAILRQKALSSWVIHSVGTKVCDKEGNSCEGEKLKDRKGAEGVLAVLKEIGIDASELERNQITEEAVKNADIVISMAEPETMPAYLLNSSKLRVWSIPDPKEATIETLRIIRDDISKRIDAFLEEV